MALWTVVVLGSLLLAADLVCGLFVLLAGSPERLGGATFPDGPRYKVAVMGDIQKGLGNFDTLLQAVHHEQAGFVLQTGDLVGENDPGHYRLVNRTFERSGLQIPFRVTPGNHDLKGSSENFEKKIGPLEQSFVVGKVAYILVQNAWGTPPDPKTLEQRITAAGPQEAVVLAMHQPPFDLQGNPKPEYGAFLAWLEKSKVAYLLCGHVHGYIKKKVGDTTVIVNGVGGDFDSWQLDQRVYLTLLDVDGDRIRDRVLEFPPVHGLAENLEHLALGHVAEVYRRRPLVCWTLTLLLSGGVGIAFRRLFAKREPFAGAPG
jgi:Icc protein